MLRVLSRIAIVLFPFALIGVAVIAYFLRWDETHCVICRGRLDDFGGCPNPDCKFRRLANEEALG